MTKFNGGENGKITALVNIAHEGPEWLEWSAALYESYAADCEDTDTSRTPEGYHHNLSVNRYANTAHRLAEQLERDVYGAQEDALYARKYVNGVEYVTPISSIVTRGEW